MEAQDARERLFAAAVEAFAERGFHATTTRDIARRIGMSPAVVYVYHESKEDLLYLVCLRGHQEGLAVMSAAARSHKDPVERLRRMVFDFTYWHAENCMLAKVAQSEMRSLTAEHHAEVVVPRRAIEAYVRQVLDDGIAAGAFDIDDGPGTAVAILALAVDLVRWFTPGGARTAGELARLNAELAVRIVARQPALRAG